MSDEQIAAELADILMHQALKGAPLSRIGTLTRLLKILRLVVRIVTARRDREAYAANAIWTGRTLAKLAGVTPSTMQRWSENGSRSVPATCDAQADLEAGDTEESWLIDSL